MSREISSGIFKISGRYFNKLKFSRGGVEDLSSEILLETKQKINVDKTNLEGKFGSN